MQSKYKPKTPNVYKEINYKKEIDYLSGAPIFRVPARQLPENVRGMCDTYRKEIFLRNDMDTHEYTTVLSHESWHARGEQNEFKTDALAGSSTGRFPRFFTHWSGRYTA